MRYSLFAPLVATTLIFAVAACDRAPTAPSEGSPASFAAGGNSVKTPFESTGFADCANGGAGEEIRISGTLNIVSQEKTTENGHTVFHFGANPQGVRGTGLSTGDVYHATGITLETVTVGPGLTDTFINNFRIIGPGLTANLLVHEVFHVTVNANGVPTVIFDRISVECKQG